MSNLVKPHGGGDLKPLLLKGDALAAEKDRAATLPKVVITSRNGRLT
jgi:sulfate adenylyltransferase